MAEWKSKAMKTLKVIGMIVPIIGVVIAIVAYFYPNFPPAQPPAEKPGSNIEIKATDSTVTNVGNTYNPVFPIWKCKYYCS